MPKRGSVGPGFCFGAITGTETRRYRVSVLTVILTNYRMKATCNNETGPKFTLIALAFWLSTTLVFQLACSSNENAHTTATTIVPPPPRQVLKLVPGQMYARIPPSPCENAAPTKTDECTGVDPKKPLLTFDLPRTDFRVGDVVSINFAVRNAQLRDNGGEFRIRYIIDDDDAQWIDRDEPFGLSGWVPGKHTIRFELIGPDGWPYRNGNQNIVTREITVQ